MADWATSWWIFAVVFLIRKSLLGYTCFGNMDVDRKMNVKEIDKGVKNKFNWKWLESKDGNGDFLSSYIRKINVAGKVRCIVCGVILTYGSSGVKAIHNHCNSEAHRKSKKIRDGNQSLPAVFQAFKAVQSGEASRPKSTVAVDGSLSSCSLPYGAAPNVHDLAHCSGKKEAPLPNVSLKNSQNKGCLDATCQIWEVSFPVI